MKTERSTIDPSKLSPSTDGVIDLHTILQHAYAHHQAGRLQQAETLYRQILQVKPDHADALYLLGILTHRSNLDQAALQYAEQAIELIRQAIAASPGNYVYRNNLGALYLSLGRVDEAITCYEAALALDPARAEAHDCLGVALERQGRLEESIGCHRKAIVLQPDYAEAHLHLGFVLVEQGLLDAGLASYRQALELKPSLVTGYNNLVWAMQFSTRYSPAESFEEHLRFARQFEAPLKPYWRCHVNVPDVQKRLKLGYVSADFREHAVAHFLLPILEHHDKATFEVYCYSSWPWADTTTERIRSCADHWVPCKDLSDDQLAERIRADGIDILVDLSGHTAENRLLTFARKPAPVQITYLGYPGTSGLSAMDYRITDALADPAGSDAFYTEKLIRLPDSLCCYRPAHHMPDVAPLPALHNGFVTFGSLNGFAKVNDDCLRVWAEILKAVPASRLLMLTVPEGLARERLVEKFAALGIPAGRLDLFGKFPSGEFYKMFQRVDIALDPFPVTGGTTTCETLWMGVPVIVLAGQRFVSRVGYSFLSAAGLGHLSTASIDDYIRTAVNLAADIPALAKLHDRLRPQVAASPLTNAAAFTRNLEAAFRHTWKNWCASQSDDAVPETARQTEEEMQRSLQLALGHHQAGRLAEAEAGYRAILQVAPHHPDALHFLGVLARQQGQPALAVELISKVVAALPSHAEAHFNLGNALNDQGLFDQAIDRYRDAIRLKPDYVKAHNNLGNVLKQLGRLTEATASFEQALALRPDFAEARNNLFALRHRPAGTA